MLNMFEFTLRPPRLHIPLDQEFFPPFQKLEFTLPLLPPYDELWFKCVFETQFSMDLRHVYSAEDPTDNKSNCLINMGTMPPYVPVLKDQQGDTIACEASFLITYAAMALVSQLGKKNPYLKALLYPGTK